MDHKLSYIFEVSKFANLHHIEVKVCLLRINANHKVGIYLKLTHNLIIDAQLTAIVHGEEKSSVGRPCKFKIGGGSSTFPSNWLRSEVFSSGYWDYLVEIACEELENSGLPVILVEFCVKLALLYCVSYWVLEDR